MTLTSQPERLETSGVVGTPQGDEDREIEGYTEDMERTTTASLSKSRLRTSPRPSSEVDLLDTSLRPAAEDSNAIPHTPSPCTDDPDVQLALIKLLHDEAKAVKADDAEVPVHLWNQFVARRETVDQATTKALETIRCFALRYYRRKLTRDCTKYLRTMHGQGWNAQKRRGKGNIDHDANAMKEIVWRAANNSWFEYPAGSRVHFFRFPRKYLKLARDGVPIFYKSAGPDVIKSQPPMQQEERRVLKDKIWKMWKKQYVEAPSRKLSSAIMYFAVPKGKDDWRTVFHAGANGLNDSVWAPSFWLPTVDSLLRIVDDTSFMEDRDLGEMFLNFELHHNTRRFTGIDVKPLEFSKEECPHRWLWWTKNLMGFRSSPYNSVKMYLIAEEIIKGDRLDGDNPFHWHHIELNLPGTKSYTPTRAWITKRRVDGSLATDMVVFVDDKRISGGGQQRVKEAGHASSTRESYLGIQDALRKWRSAGGTKLPGAWAGAVVHVDEEKGVMILTSQEKWDRMKEICRHWLEIVAAGETALDFKKLQSDRGFMVYATRPYPAMKPYLKGFHLSLEMWRGDRDAEGWKIKDKSTRDPDDEEDDEEAILAGLGTHVGPPSGITCAVPRFRSDLEAILVLAASPTPLKRVVRSKKMLTAYYGFGDASSDGFGATVE